MLRGLVVVALVCLVAGCSSDPEPDPEPSPRPVIAAGDEYVALGDSYTSAPSTGPATGPASCRRTTANYPHLVAEQLDLNLDDVSCGGARTDDVTGSQETFDGTRQPPQLDAVSPTADLVTVSVGGNDDALFGRLTGLCLGLGAVDPEGAPCTEADEDAEPGKDVASVVAGIERRLTSVLEEVVDAAPDARVVVVGYPRFAPETRSCGQFPVAEGDLPFVARLNQMLVEAQEHAADEAGVEYLDVYAATEGHDVCAEEPWVAGLEPAAGAARFHPYPQEQQVVADLLVGLVA